MMHGCLLIPDITSNIFEKLFVNIDDRMEGGAIKDDLLAEQTLASLSRTCRAFLGA
jgi:hypothetical protein